MKRIIYKITLLLNFIFSQISFAENYHAHPENNFGQVKKSRAIFLATEQLRNLADYNDSINRESQRELYAQLAQDSILVDLLNIRDLSQESRAMRIRTQLRVWKTNYPSLSASFDDFLNYSFSTEEILQIAGELINLNRRFLGGFFHNTNSNIINQTYFGNSDHFQQGFSRNLQNIAERLCRGENISDLSGSLGQNFFIQLGSSASRYYQFAPNWFQNYLDNRVIGQNRTCQTLVRDLFHIVQPHRSPLESVEDNGGQIEALSAELARKVFANTSNLRSNILIQYLLTLKTRIRRLPINLSLLEALRFSLNSTNSNLSLEDRHLIRLLALASHNHSVELYIMKIPLAHLTNKSEAAQLSSEVADGLNHLYKLINDYHSRRRRNGSRDLIDLAERPYHFWGAALVSCELKINGYNTFLTTQLGRILGFTYEHMTFLERQQNGSREVFDSNSDDIQLHFDGSSFGSRSCQIL